MGNHHVPDALAGAPLGFAMGAVEPAVAGKLGLLGPATDQAPLEALEPEA